jgi:3-O-methylgallate 3,4-dioxygenase
MATIIGGLAMSHAPQLIMPARQWSELPTRTKGPFHPKADIERELTVEAMLAKEARCKKALSTLSAQLYLWRPDAVVVVGDDQHENVLDDNQPPFLIYTAPETDATMHFLYLGDRAEDQMSRYAVASNVSRALLDGLMESGFDPAWSTRTRSATGLGHAFGRTLRFLMPHEAMPIVPVMINTYYPPAPNARRCFALGKAMRDAIEAMPGDMRVVFVASGGLSHFVIKERFDAEFMTALENNDEAYLSSIPQTALIGGTSEILTWIAVAGVMQCGARMVDYVPCYRNDRGVGCGMGFAIWQ